MAHDPGFTGGARVSATTDADGHLIIRNEAGDVSMVEASPAAYKEAGRFKSERAGGEQGWAHPVVFGGKLYIRDWEALTAYDLQAK